MIESIQNFTGPRNITDARAFFGFVKQVSFAFSKCDDIVAFRHFLSPKVKFLWTGDLLGNRLFSSRFNDDAQSWYSAIEGETLTVYWAKDRADFFQYGCPNLFIGVDHEPLLAFFRENPKPLDQIVNKRLRKYVS